MINFNSDKVRKRISQIIIAIIVLAMVLTIVLPALT